MKDKEMKRKCKERRKCNEVKGRKGKERKIRKASERKGGKRGKGKGIVKMRRKRKEKST